MPRAADFHDPIADARLPKAAGLVDNTAALDAAVDVLDAHATAGEAPIRRSWRTREVPPPRLPGWHDDLHVVERERQEAQILEQSAARGQGRRCGIGHPLIMGAPRIGGTEKEDRQCRIDQQHVLSRVAFFLAAITARLLSRILGTPDAPFGAIMANRGEAGGSAGIGDPSVGTTRAAASASAAPRRVDNAAKDRRGASPRVRSVACRTANKR
jgi:hypothetical protein